MNNDQFRRLLFDNASNTPSTSTSTSKSPGPSPPPPPPPPSNLGSRQTPSIPMTPRTVTRPDFASQLASHRSEPPTKRFKSSSAPKGTRLPSGYQDRAQQRQTETEASVGDEDVEKRVAELEKMVKLGQIDNETFERLRAQLGIGGDLGSTHMVKGLDWELLRRVRAGEEVGGSPLPSGDGEGGEDKDGEGGEDPDEEFERVLEEKGKEVTVPKAREREEGKKKGSMAPPPVARSRDEILRQLKASREKAKIQTQTQTQDQDQEQEHAESLGTRFKRIGETKTKPEKKRFVETDETGRRREVLIITDAEGKTKRKVKWLDKPGETVKRNTGINTDTGLLVPGKDKRLGMEVPDFAKAEPEEEDDDIFEGAGDYNPLGELQDEESSDEESESKLEKTESPAEPVEKSTKSDAAGPVEPVEPAEPSKPRNYFTTSTGPREDRSKPLMKDPTLMAAFKRAASLRQAPTETDDGDQPGEETSQHRRNFLEEVRRREAQDAMDMDLGFGGSRIEDEEDDEAVLFEGEGRNKRKRGPKKRKGNKESVSDVMGVLQGRRQV